jgi:hypothetical protein
MRFMPKLMGFLGESVKKFACPKLKFGKGESAQIFTGLWAFVQCPWQKLPSQIYEARSKARRQRDPLR